MLLLLGCALLRLLFLGDFPPQIHNDESATGIAIQVFMEPNGPWALKGSSYGGHPAFGFWLSSIPSQLAGVVTLENIRIASGILGVLSLVFMALAVRDGVGRGTSILFLLFALPFHLHVHYSRTAFAYTHALFASAVFFWMAVRFWKAPSRLNTVVLGIGIGLCLLVYSAAHVMPLALLATLVIRRVFPPSHPALPKSSLAAVARTGAYAFIGFLIAFGLQLHEWIFHGYASRASSQFILSPGSRTHIQSSVGHPMTDLEIVINSFWRTLRFFYSEDSAGQYSFRGAPLDTIGTSLACLGILVLLRRAFARDFTALLTLFSAVGTVAGSILMVEANFSPHLVLFSLLIPLAMAIGLSILVGPFARKHLLLAALPAIALAAWWSWWNYNYYDTNTRNNSRGRHVWLLHLPIDTFAVRSLHNFTPRNEDLGESFFQLVYPNSSRANHTTEDVQLAFTSLTAARDKGECPCLWLVTEAGAPTFTELLTTHSIPFTAFQKKFYDPKLDSSVFLIQ